MVLLLDAIAAELQCTRKGVGIRLNHPLDRQRIIDSFYNSKVRTLYGGKSGQKREFYLENITKEPATELTAYGNLNKIYNISVPQHMYALYRIRVKYPYHPCVVEKQLNRRRRSSRIDRYYPLELLEIVSENGSDDGRESADENKDFEEEDKESSDEITIEELNITKSIPDEVDKLSRQMRKRLGKHLFEEIPSKKMAEDDDKSADSNKEKKEQNNCSYCGEELLNGGHWPPLASRLPSWSLRSFSLEKEEEGDGINGEEDKKSTSSNVEFYI